MNIQDFNSAIANTGQAQNASMVNMADVAQVTRAISQLVPLFNEQSQGDVAVVRALDAVAAKLASVSKNITIQNVNSPDSVKINNLPDIRGDMAKLISAINNVTTQVSKDDGSSRTLTKISSQLQKFIDKTSHEEETLDLSMFRVSDSAEPVTGYQYFGFIDASGTWYILYNEAVEGRVRYCFGKRGYTRAWDDFSNLEYKLLNEAINAIIN